MNSNYIYTKVNELIDKYKTNNPFELIEYLKIKLMSSNNEELKGYCISVKNYPYIGVSRLLSDPEQRIVATHELGHFILHMDQTSLYRFEDDNIYNSSDKTEYQANLFAADLLIPDEDVEDIVKDESINYFSLCSMLSVTPELMSFKLFSMKKRGFNYNTLITPKSDFLRS